MLDGRSISSKTPLGSALFDALDPGSNTMEGASWERLVANATQTGKALSEGKVPHVSYALRRFWNRLLGFTKTVPFVDLTELRYNVNFRDALDAWIETIEGKGLVPLLLIDEANSVFGGNDVVQRQQTLDALKYITRQTKQEMKLTAIMVASEYSEPYRLMDLGFKTGNLSSVAVLSEPEPASMRKLLMERWGMGPNLADSVMAVYGGHMQYCCLTVQGLDHAYSEHRDVGTPPRIPPVQFLADVSNNTHMCFEKYDETLEEMARRGFAYVKRSSEEAKLITRLNVGCSVSVHSDGLSLPYGSLKGDAIVPSVQMGRVVIARCTPMPTPTTPTPTPCSTPSPTPSPTLSPTPSSTPSSTPSPTLSPVNAHKNPDAHINPDVHTDAPRCPPSQ
eukprot:TRINITY_DN4583_c0_g1_i2.p1 TRINITY_DN4583_c0_g1~~TRINITY_DN4583_c0_g1_i2.p1  ORF type:complete len:392 (+),score=50.06 TRINITY_DN4583_c0_g1_i2:1274-2449(+)